MRRAIEYAVGRPDGTALVLRFGAALQRYWWVRSVYAEALGLLVPVLRRPGARADTELFGAALITAIIAAHPIDIAAARELGDQAMELARQLGDDRLLIDSLAVHCATCCFSGQLERGLSLGQESVERARRLGDDVLLGGSLWRT